MLFPEAAGRRLHETKNTKILGTATIGGHKCAVIDGDDVELWIGKRDLALYKLKGKDLGWVTEYKPLLNSNVRN
ncbi:MAG TPA: hypothetical protein VG944_03705, partial [Fimbriimonas sp.]|nr:hypothetical protein [Fimbriimonas sp.]